jgi:heme/copper-type cytochrome/quinol oxidase subunit 3
MTPYIAPYFATRPRRITAIVIVANFVFFAALLAAMFYLRSAAADWPVPFHFPSMLMSASLTLFALCASVTAAVGAAQSHNADREPAVRWVAIAISCWFVFLFLEIVEWVRLIWLEKLGIDTPFGGTFIALTGTHWVCAIACVGWLAWGAADVGKRDVLAAALYSHFLNAWWLVLWVSLYVFNANLTEF